MADPQAVATSPPVASTPAFVATLAALIGTIAVLLFFDLSLAKIDRQESRAHAASEYRDGLALLGSGHAKEAAVHFNAAVAIQRSNIDYALALAEARLQEGEVVEAEATLNTLLDRAENDGAVNLVMARVMVRQHRPDDAQAYFHRAIFGRWGADSVQRRATARFELIEMLAGLGRERDLLAELLPLEDTPDDSIALRKRLGQLFIVAGSPSRAANIFRDLLRKDPRDADAYAGMGEAALALGNFITARADLAEAARLSPERPSIAGRLALADSLLALDPLARNIGRHERYLRDRAFLERTLVAIRRCGAGGALADSAAAHLAQSATPAREDEAGDALLALASDLWNARPARCNRAATGDEALSLLHGRIDR